MYGLRVFNNSFTEKGRNGELLVNQCIKDHLNPDDYSLLENITLPTNDNGSTQIDHILISKFGIFVIETKNMTGWIFGNESSKSWTKTLYNKKIQFQNPIRQNYKHIKAVSRLLGIAANRIYSLVVFVGDADFKTIIPHNVFLDDDFIPFIQSKNQRIYNDQQIKRFISKLEKNRFDDSIETERKHIEYLDNLHNKINSTYISDSNIVSSLKKTNKEIQITPQTVTIDTDSYRWNLKKSERNPFAIFLIILGLLLTLFYFKNNNQKEIYSHIEPKTTKLTKPLNNEQKEKPEQETNILKPKESIAKLAPIEHDRSHKINTEIYQKQETTSHPTKTKEEVLLDAKRKCNFASYESITAYDDIFAQEKTNKLCSEYRELKNRFETE